MNNFNDVCPSGNIMLKREVGDLIFTKPICKFCDNTGRIYDWRTYVNACRKSGIISPADALRTCRNIRDGWSACGGRRKYHSALCPICEGPDE